MSGNNKTADGKPKLTDEQKQKIKKYGIFACMFVVFAGCLWFIFAPSADDKAKEEAKAGFNSEIPMPKNEGIVGDKKSAYEQELIAQKQAERMRSLQDFGSLLGNETESLSGDLDLMTNETGARNTSPKGNSNRNVSSPVESSVTAYNDINRNLGSFYEKPREDPEKKRMAEELEELKGLLDTKDNRQNMVDEQMELMEKTFQMAAKYMPQTQAQGQMQTPFADAGMLDAEIETAVADARQTLRNTSGKTVVASVSQVNERTVSALYQNISDEDFMEAYAKPRNMGFITAAAQKGDEPKNTIAACIHSDQTIIDGQSVRLRLLEPLQAGNTIVPKNSILTGMARIQGERLGISVVSLEVGGTIIPVSLRVFDTDGQQGIFIPGSMELNAAKEIAANMGTSVGTSFNISNDAGEQFVADMGRSLVQGTSQFFSRKIREVKVNLKAGYRLLLLAE